MRAVAKVLELSGVPAAVSLVMLAICSKSPSIEPTRIYQAEDAATFLNGAGLDADHVAELDGKLMAGFVRATKPKATSCCAPGCCS